MSDPDLRIVYRSDLIAAGWPERTVDGVFRRLGRREPGCRRAYVLMSDLTSGVANTTSGRVDRRDRETGSAVRVPRTPMPSAATATIGGAVGSAWIVPRGEGKTRRFLVRYRAGGREAKVEHAGSFKRRSEAVLREQFVSGLIAAGRGDDVRRLLRSGKSETGYTLTKAAERWQASRRDVSEGTAQTYKVALNRILPKIGDLELSAIDVQVLDDMVSQLSKLKRESLRKTLNVLAMILDHEGVNPNPVRDKRIKLPRADKRHVSPPTADHVEAVYRLLPTTYKLPLLLADATGMRVSEIQYLTWGDLDEPRGRFRVSAAVSKTGTARWVEPPIVLYEAITALVPRDDRVPDRPVFGGFGADRFRTALQRACKAAGIPTFSPHDLRHRRVSLLHLSGVPFARIGELVGHGDLVTTVRTYTHVVADDRELDYVALRG